MSRFAVTRSTAIALVALAFLASPVAAMDAGKPEKAWQAVITGQIEAFRTRDGSAALGFAGRDFQMQFRNPDAFVATVEAMGYDPLVRSRSHSFGDFTQMDDTHVVQLVRIVGPDQLIYEALYQLEQEPGGWRVEGVALKREAGVAI